LKLTCESEKSATRKIQQW